MKITIVIECEDEVSVASHLAALKQKILMRVKRLNTKSEYPFKPVSFDYTNCFGSHSVTIEDDD